MTETCRTCHTEIEFVSHTYVDSNRRPTGTDGHRHRPQPRPFDEIAREVHGAEYDAPLPGEPGATHPRP